MKSWLVINEPLASVTVRFPKVRLKSRDERLRERAATYVKDGWRNSLSEKDYQQNVRLRLALRVATMMVERDAVLGVVSGRRPVWCYGSTIRIPRWRWRKRRKIERDLWQGHRISKWW